MRRKGGGFSLLIRVTVYGVLARYLPEPDPAGPIDLEVPAGATAGDAIHVLGLPPQHVALIAINRRRAGRDQVLQPGDQVTFFPPVAGGGSA